MSMTPNLIIVERDPVVAMDLSQILTNWLPQSVVSVFSNLAEAGAAAKDRVRPLVAVVNAPETEIERARDGGLLMSLSDHVVLLVDTAEELQPVPGNCVLVQRPYTSETLTQALVTLDAAQC